MDPLKAHEQLILEWLELRRMADEAARLQNMVDPERRHNYGSLIERVEAMGRSIIRIEDRLFGNGQPGIITVIEDRQAQQETNIALLKQRGELIAGAISLALLGLSVWAAFKH